MAEREATVLDTLTLQRNLLLVLSLVVLPTCFVVALTVVRAITKPIEVIVSHTERMANGDLTGEIVVRSDNEIDSLALSLTKTRNKFIDVSRKINESTDSVIEVITQVSKGNMELSSRTTEQASSLEETAATMEEMNATVNRNAQNMQEADQLAKKARDQAEKGSSVVAEAIEAMGDINQASRKIMDIIGVIDEIAFQTNLLSLNAAVEAARAGDQGRGFAVVATEVGNLAQRSASAAKEIKDLIEDTVNKVKHGTELVSSSGKSLEDIVTSARQATEMMADVSNAMREQVTGIDQVNKAIVQIEESTQLNSTLVEEATSAGHMMEEKAKGMKAAVSFFKISTSASTRPVPLSRSTKTQTRAKKNNPEFERRGPNRPFAKEKPSRRTEKPTASPVVLADKPTSASSADYEEWKSF